MRPWVAAWSEVVWRAVLGLVSLQLAAHLEHHPLQCAHPFQALCGRVLVGLHQFGHRVELLVDGRHRAPGVAGGIGGGLVDATQVGQEHQVGLEAPDGRGQGLQPAKAQVEPVHAVGRQPFQGAKLDLDGVVVALRRPPPRASAGGRVAGTRCRRVDPAFEAVDPVGQGGEGPGAVLDPAGQPGQGRVGERVGRRMSGRFGHRPPEADTGGRRWHGRNRCRQRRAEGGHRRQLRKHRPRRRRTPGEGSRQGGQWPEGCGGGAARRRSGNGRRSRWQPGRDQPGLRRTVGIGRGLGRRGPDPRLAPVAVDHIGHTAPVTASLGARWRRCRDPTEGLLPLQ